MKYETRLNELGIVLPAPAQPLAAYVPALLVDGWAYVSGQLPSQAGQIVCQGKLGEEITVDEGYQAARLCAINCLAALKMAIGDLDRVQQVVKITGFVASAPGFTAQPAVINGASELMEALFGAAGKHARAAVGVCELPLGAAVEVELIVRVKQE